MKYVSTRGKAAAKTFTQTVIEGLARDGGLLVPERIPVLSEKLEKLKTLSYKDLALEIFLPFVDGEVSKDTLAHIIELSYSSFSAPEVTPLRFADSVVVLELFHGPTLAFKDVALQFLGNLFENILKNEQISINIVGATSGDTGSAAIHGVRGKENIKIFMLHPQGKVSPIQERQMTTVLDENVFNIAVEGTFDDTQRIVKEVFNDLAFKDKYNLGAVNSINWARVMAQIVYYFYAAFRFKERYRDLPVVFSVPTGNFGDIYAGYIAKRMGLPIEKLILATNENDILFRVLNSGLYKIGVVQPTLSPSMDIQISSNFERFLFEIVEREGEMVCRKMDDLASKGGFSLSLDQLAIAQKDFTAIRVDTSQMLDTIKKYRKSGITLDPHTAIGVAASEKTKYSKVICLATAHPAKFGDAIVRATGETPDIPESLAGIEEKKTKCLSSKQDYREIKRIIEAELAQQG